MDPNVRLALLILLLFVYLFICAGLFHALEPYEGGNWWENMDQNSTVGNASDRNATRPLSLSIAPRSYFESFFYMVTVITTIGYGHITPYTTFAKVFTAVFANFGIPLLVYIIAIIGTKSTNLVLAGEDRFLRRVPGPYGRRTVTVMLVELFGLFFILMIPGAIVARLEGWSFGDGVWYTFVSVTTIGFGDLVSGMSSNSIDANPNLSAYNVYILCKFCYLLIGLVYIATIWLLIADVLPPIQPEDTKVEKTEEQEQEPEPSGTLLTNQA